MNGTMAGWAVTYLESAVVMGSGPSASRSPGMTGG